MNNEQIVWVIGGCNYDAPVLHSIWTDPLKAIEAAKKLEEETGALYEPEPFYLNEVINNNLDWQCIQVKLYSAVLYGTEGIIVRTGKIPKTYYWFNNDYILNYLDYKDDTLVTGIQSSISKEHLESLMPKLIDGTTIRFLNKEFNYTKQDKLYVLDNNCKLRQEWLDERY
jgi:hypothetical protein